MKRTARKSTQSNKSIEEDVSKLSIKNEDSNSVMGLPAIKKNEDSNSVMGLPAIKLKETNSSEKRPTATTDSSRDHCVKVEKSGGMKIKEEPGVEKDEERGAVGGFNSQIKSTKNSTTDQKTNSSKSPSYPHFQKKKIVFENVSDDAKSEADDSPIIEKEPAGVLYDGKGIHIATGLDLCDCVADINCPGCWFPCPECGAIKCGPHCRRYRTFMYKKIVVDGQKYVYLNELS